MYRDFLSNLELFEIGMEKVAREWVHSCDQFLTNPSINRIAWLGQSAMCSMTGIPSAFRGGFRLLSASGQESANKCAEEFLTRWVINNGGSREG